MDQHSFWHVREDSATAMPASLVRGFHEDDHNNIHRAEKVLSDATALVDRGLELFIEPVRGALVAKDQIEWDESLLATPSHARERLQRCTRTEVAYSSGISGRVAAPDPKNA